MSDALNYPSAVEAQKHFNGKERSKTLRMLRFVVRHGKAPTKWAREAFDFYDLDSLRGPDPNHVNADCRRYNHYALNERGKLLLAQLREKLS